MGALLIVLWTLSLVGIWLKYTSFDLKEVKGKQYTKQYSLHHAALVTSLVLGQLIGNISW
jgi:hypothetical protein